MSIMCSSFLAIPESLFLKNSSIAVVITKYGGHIGFLEGLSPFGKTWMNRFLAECLSLISENPRDLIGCR